MVVIVLIAALMLTGCAAPAEDPQVAAAVAPVRAAYAKVEATQADLPPAESDSERLERLMSLDQAGRQAMRRIDFSALPEPQRAAARGTAIAEIMARDRANLAALKAMVPAEGWFAKDRYSPAARQAAFLIVQHAADDPAFMRDALARMEPLVATGDVSGEAYAMLFDRVAVQEGKPQRYGTQMVCKGGRWALADMEDPTAVDALRKQVGIKIGLAEYEAKFANMTDCG